MPKHRLVPPCEYCGLYDHMSHCSECGGAMDDRCKRCSTPTLQTFPSAEPSGDWWDTSNPFDIPEDN